jgi:cellulose synthase/poly-beta-1,6-N-acetylglucosamine synthase-like glycosyltransferase
MPLPTRRLSVILCSAGRPHLVAGAVAALADQDGWQPGDEVVVLLNGAKRAEARARIEASPPAKGPWELRLHESTERGVSAARNRAAGLARGEVLIYLDDDARPGPGWLNTWRQAFVADPCLSAAGGPIHPAWPGSPPRFFHPRLAPYWAVTGHRDPRSPSRPGDTAYGANMAVRAEALTSIGGFRTEVGWGSAADVAGEDADVLIRLDHAGHRLGWVPGAEVRHLIDAERVHLLWLLRRAHLHGRTDMALGAQRPPARLLVTSGWRTLARGLVAHPHSWRASVAVDLARRARLLGRRQA